MIPNRTNLKLKVHWFFFLTISHFPPIVFQKTRKNWIHIQIFQLMSNNSGFHPTMLSNEDEWALNNYLVGGKRGVKFIKPTLPAKKRNKGTIILMMTYKT